MRSSRTIRTRKSPQRRTFGTSATTYIPIVLAILSLFVLLIFETGIIGSIHKGYTYQTAFRIQTEALLRGSIQLSPFPHLHWRDWIWANGLHQNWGLGIPLLLLPFEALAKLFGQRGFPDQLVFVLFYLLTGGLLFSELSLLVKSWMGRRKNETLFPWCFAGIGVTITLLSPTLIGICRVMNPTYDGATCFSIVLCFLLFGMTLRHARTKAIQDFVFVCLCSGFALWVRPTGGIFYGTIAVLIGLSVRLNQPEEKMKEIHRMLPVSRSTRAWHSVSSG